MARILKSCSETELMCNCDVIFPQLDLFIDCLVKAGFLEVSKGKDGPGMFQATKKGEEFLRDYERVKKILTRVERREPQLE